MEPYWSPIGAIQSQIAQYKNYGIMECLGAPKLKSRETNFLRYQICEANLTQKSSIRSVRLDMEIIVGPHIITGNPRNTKKCYFSAGNAMNTRKLILITETIINRPSNAIN